MRAYHTAASGHEVGNGPDQLRPGRIGMDVEDKYFAGVQAGSPKIAPVECQSHMMDLVSPAHGYRMYDFAILRRVRIHRNGNQLVLLIPDSFRAEGPDIHEILLPDYFGHAGRQSGFVGPC